MTSKVNASLFKVHQNDELWDLDLAYIENLIKNIYIFLKHVFIVEGQSIKTSFGDVLDFLHTLVWANLKICNGQQNTVHRTFTMVNSFETAQFCWHVKITRDLTV